MNILKKSVLALVLILVGFASNAQQDSSVKKYPSLLWEITGNGMEKPSYLFGTMHVSAKMAFYLSDSFFSALKSVDVVGLESRPDEWLPNLVAMGLLNPYSLGQGYNYTRAPNSFNDPTFQLSKGSMEDVRMAIAQDNQLINALLYRTNAGMQDFQERTYLDLFIFQTGMKLNKELLSLEDYAESLTSVTMAGLDIGGYSEDSDDFEPKTSDNTRFYRGYTDDWEIMEDAYRRGDLDILDSLDIATSTPHERKYMLLDRNESIVQRADSVMKKRSLFIAVGAAHLPGEGGIIELLRSLGYTVRPVMQKGRDEKSRKKYDEILVSHPVKTFVSSDSMFRADFPGTATEIPYIDGSAVILLPDMVNGSYYIVTRTAYHRSLWNESPEYVLERIDSFLYEYVPGDIISNDKIMVSGYPGFDIMNKTRSGDLQRSRIIILPDEIILVKLAGKGKHAKSKQVSSFFNSIKLKAPAQVWQQVPVENAHLSFEFPGKPSLNFLKNNQEGSQERKEFILSGSEKENVYFVTSYPVERNMVVRNDTAELRFALTSFKSTGNIVQKTAKYVEIDGLLALEWEVEWDNTPMRIRAVKHHGSVVVYGVMLRNNGVEVERFLQSVRRHQVTAPEYEWVHDSSLYASYKGPKPVESDFYRSFRQYRYKWNGNSSTLNNTIDGETIDVSISYTDPYDKPYDTSKYFKIINGWEEELEEGLFVDKSERVQNGIYVSQDFRYRDTGTTTCMFYREMWSPYAAYRINFTYDTTQGLSPMATSVLNTFTPFDSVPNQGLSLRGKDKFWSDIASSDTLLVQAAIEGLSGITFDAKDVPRLISILDTAASSKTLRVKLRREIAFTKSPESLEYYLNKYKQVGDTTTMQLKALEYVFRQSSDTAYKKAREILVKTPPLPGSSYNLNGIFRKMDDSLELACILVPDILELTEFDEYKDHVYELLAELADSGFVSKGMVKYPTDELLRHANNELRRLNSSAKKKDENQYYSSEGNSSYELRTLIHALYPFRSTNKEIAELIDKAALVSDEELQLNLLKLKFEKEKVIDTALVAKLAAKEEKRFELYSWLLEVEKAGEFPKAYAIQDSLLKPILHSEDFSGQGIVLDSLVWLKKDMVLMGKDTSYLYYFRVYNQYQLKWAYACIALHTSTADGLPKTAKVFSQLGSWKAEDKVDEKLTTYSEQIAIRYYTGFPKKKDSYREQEYYYEEDYYSGY